MQIARLTLLLFTLVSTAAYAQTFEQLTFLRLHDAPMSTRGLAMGATSSEDDIESNPAHLASLRQPMFTLGGARTTFQYEHFELTENYVVSRWRDRSRSTLSHATIAFPVGSAVVGMYYRNEPRITGATPNVSTSGTEPYTPVACDLPSCYAYLVADPAFRWRDVRYGIGTAFERGRFSFGVGAEVREIDEQTEKRRYPMPSLSGEHEIVFRRTSGSEIVPNAGIRFRATPRVTLAAAYNGGASYRSIEEVCAAPFVNRPECTSVLARLNETTRRTPDAYRASVTGTPVERLTLTTEAVRRKYHDTTSFGIDLLPRDVTELHAGAEYRVHRVALRAGWWRDPSRFGFGRSGLETLLDDDIDHLTFGGGIDVGPARFDVAFDDADAPGVRRASVGLTYRLAQR